MYALIIKDEFGNTMTEHVAINADDVVYFEEWHRFNVASEWRKSHHLTSWVKREHPNWTIQSREFDISELFKV